MEEIKIIKEKIALKLFEDSFNNVMILLKVIANAYENGLIENNQDFKDLMTIYSALSSNDKTILKTLEKFKDKNFTATLYDVYKQAQYSAFEKLQAECIKPEDLETEEPFLNIQKMPVKMLVNISRMDRNQQLSDSELDKLLDSYIYPRTQRKVTADFKSLSFISNHDIRAFRDVAQFVTFVYPSDIPNGYLITITRKDAQVEFSDKKPVSRIAPYFSTPQSLLDSTNEYNEVAVLRKDPYNDESREIKPIAILCNKNITALEQRIADRLGIKIILSETTYVAKKYTTKRKIDYTNYNAKSEIKYDFDIAEAGRQ